MAKELCIRCELKPVCEEDDYGEHCAECLAIIEDNRAEAAYERSLNESFRGGEAEAYIGEVLEELQKELKR